MRIISLLDDKVGDLIYIDREKIGTCHVVMEIFGFRSRSNFWQGWGDAWDVLITVDFFCKILLTDICDTCKMEAN